MGSAGDSPARGPIYDTHIHLWNATRPSGVPWPPPENTRLFRDVLPADYEAAARPLGIVGTGIVEASDRHEDTGWVLDVTRGNAFFGFLVAQLEIGAADFVSKLDEITADPRVVGLRGFLWSPTLTLAPEQRLHLQALAARGLSLDIISRGDFNPKDKLDALAGAVPDLRIVVDHLGGARGTQPDPKWAADMRRLARHANVHVKLSALYDMFNPGADETHPWQAPTDVAAYRAHFDVLFEAFSPQRLLFGSNWPVCTMGGSLADEIAIMEEYLAPLGQPIRDAVMHDNARRVYRRS